jgi:hypothetical protein
MSFCWRLYHDEVDYDIPFFIQEVYVILLDFGLNISLGFPDVADVRPSMVVNSVLSVKGGELFLCAQLERIQIVRSVALR